MPAHVTSTTHQYVPVLRRAAPNPFPPGCAGTGGCLHPSHLAWLNPSPLFLPHRLPGTKTADPSHQQSPAALHLPHAATTAHPNVPTRMGGQLLPGMVVPTLLLSLAELQEPHSLGGHPARRAPPTSLPWAAGTTGGPLQAGGPCRTPHAPRSQSRVRGKGGEKKKKKNPTLLSAIF